MGEEKVNHFSGLLIESRRLLRPDLLPFLNSFTNQAIYRFGKSSAGLIGRHLQETDRILRAFGNLLDRMNLTVPSNASRAKSPDLTQAKSGEEPDKDQRAYHLHRILRQADLCSDLEVTGRKVRGFKVDPG